MQLPPLLEGRLIRRYKRFLADVELTTGEVVVAHCPNPGSMKTCQPANATVWLSRSLNPKRKLPFTWELVVAEQKHVLINTMRANDIVLEALGDGVIRQVTGFDSIRREVPYGQGSRVDFHVSWNKRQCYLEVKNVTMADKGDTAMFPDSVTKRGTKHLMELMEVAKAGHRAVLLFCCSREGTKAVRPAAEIDPTYAETLRQASAKGVEILAYACAVCPTEISMRHQVPVHLQ